MIDYKALYQKKLQNADSAAKLLPKTGNISIPFFGGMPSDLLQAVGRMAKAGSYDQLNLYYMHSTPQMGEALLNPEVAKIIKPKPFYMGAAERALVHEGLKDGIKYIEYMPGSFSQIPHLMADVIGIDTFMVAVSPMDAHGYFSIGISGAYTQKVMRQCRQLIVEVNQHIPRSFGDSLIHISEVAAITECHQPLSSLAFRPATPVDEQISQYILPMIPDRACVQFGIGGVPNVIASMLKNHKDLGIHTELLADGLLDLIEAGAVTNRYKKVKPYKTIFNVAMGSQNLYDFIHDNPGVECYGADFVNDPGVIAQNDNMISVNAFVEIDLNGQVNAEFVESRQFSAPGGQLDFVKGAVKSKGGKSFLASSSTAAHGKVSRIVPRLNSIVTDPRMDVQYVVTEHGICNLQGKSTSERARALIDLADPQFRESLHDEAKRQGLI